LLESGYTYNYVTYHYSTEATFYDVGIFTKKGTGITKNEDGTIVVDSATIDPIYAYSMTIYDRDADPTGSIIYGMVLDGKHYRTEEFIGWDIPQIANAKSKEGKPLWNSTEVRVGIVTTKIKKETTTHESA